MGQNLRLQFWGGWGALLWRFVADEDQMAGRWALAIVPSPEQEQAQESGAAGCATGASHSVPLPLTPVTASFFTRQVGSLLYRII